MAMRRIETPVHEGSIPFAAALILVVPFAPEYREFCGGEHVDAKRWRESRSDSSSLHRNSLRSGTGNLFAINRELKKPIRELKGLIRDIDLRPAI
jgi:hypothetical protein